MSGYKLILKVHSIQRNWTQVGGQWHTRVVAQGVGSTGGVGTGGSGTTGGCTAGSGTGGDGTQGNGGHKAVEGT
jgi:hypothetical protein